VKAFTRKLGLAFVAIGMLGVTGCGADNESEGAKANTNLGKATAPDPNALPKETIVPPKSNNDRKPGPMIGAPQGKPKTEATPK
jgi:hypothetical protein